MKKSCNISNVSLLLTFIVVLFLVFRMWCDGAELFSIEKPRVSMYTKVANFMSGKKTKEDASSEKVEVGSDYLEPEEGYLESEATHLESDGDYIDIEGDYLEPEGGYLEPDGGYLEPEGGYLEPEADHQEQEINQPVEKSTSFVVNYKKPNHIINDSMYKGLCTRAKDELECQTHCDQSNCNMYTYLNSGSLSKCPNSKCMLYHNLNKDQTLEWVSGGNDLIANHGWNVGKSGPSSFA